MEGILQKKEFSKSLDWWEKVQRIIPSGCSTLAKTPERLFPGYTPICCAKSNGSRFEDIDGNTWIDCEMGMGTVIWGHARKEINDAIIEQLSKGSSYSIPADVECELAILLLSRFKHYKSIRFSKNGVDVVSAAVRLVRAKSGKNIILYNAYHGWHDWCAYGFYNKDYENLGIPSDVEKNVKWLSDNTYSRFMEITKYNDDIAGIVICPADWACNELELVVDYCKHNNITVIFDEVTSGMRMGKQATAGEYNIWPDLLCISKGLANGLPLAAIMGNYEDMKYLSQVKFSTAHSSECVAMAAAIAAEKLLQKIDNWPTWKSQTQKVMDCIGEEIFELKLDNSLELNGYYGSFHIKTKGEKNFYKDPFREHFVKYLASKGIFSKGFILFCDQHTEEEILYVKNSILESLKIWANKKSKIN